MLDIGTSEDPFADHGDNANTQRCGAHGIDSTGDGKVDSMFLDTTGDGRADTVHPIDDFNDFDESDEDT